jgi:hypothetical protein
MVVVDSVPPHASKSGITRVVLASVVLLFNRRGASEPANGLRSKHEETVRWLGEEKRERKKERKGRNEKKKKNENENENEMK